MTKAADLSMSSTFAGVASRSALLSHAINGAASTDRMVTTMGQSKSTGTMTAASLWSFLNRYLYFND